MAKVVTISARKTSDPHRLCRPDITEISSIPNNGNRAARNRGANHAIGKSTKVGLQNIADRYGLITDKVVKIENNNKIFKVSLPLLIKMNNRMYTDDLENSKYVRALEKV